MTQKTFQTLGISIFIGVVLLALVWFVMASDSSSIEFTTLSIEEMSSTVGGTGYRWDGNHTPRSGALASCSGQPPCSPSQSNPAIYTPEVYACTNCSSGQNEYHKFTHAAYFKSWCVSQQPNKCSIRNQGFGSVDDCEHQTGTTC